MERVSSERSEMFFPCNVDVPMERWPIANWVLIVVTSCVSILTMVGAIPTGNWMLIGPGEYFTVGGLFGSLVSTRASSTSPGTCSSSSCLATR